MEWYRRLLVCVTLICLPLVGAGCHWFRAKEGRPPTAPTVEKPDPKAVEEAIHRAQDFLLGKQHPEGYWVGFLENDTSVTGLYLLLCQYLGAVDPARSEKAIRYLLRTRNEEGGWVQYPHGPSSLDVTVINYVALALSGVPENDPAMEKTRLLVTRLGGLKKVSFFTRIVLGFYGIFPPESLPWVTSRLIDHSSLIYRQGFPRTIFIPYMVLYERKAVKDFSGRLPVAMALWGKAKEKSKTEKLFEDVFGEIGQIRDKAVSPPHQKKCLEWIGQHQEEDGTWAGVFQVTFFSMMALDSDHDKPWDEALAKGMKGVISYQVETQDEVIQQFSVSPVMDTAFAIRALSLAGVDSGSKAIQSALQWLMSKQSLREGDWKHNNQKGEPGGWGFEFHNTWYPDLDSTSMVLNAASYVNETARKPYYPQIDRGMNWIMSMQNWDGSFAVWDKNNWLVFKALSAVMDVGDYGHADTTARVILPLARLQHLDRYKGNSDLGKTLHSAEWYLWTHQQSFKNWPGRFGVNYTYGTGQVLEALGTDGITVSNHLVLSAVNWLTSVQNPDGGWGESPKSYEEDKFVAAPSTAAQTSAVLQGILAVEAQCQQTIDHGIQYLLASQKPDGHWDDQAFFSVNIPQAWYGRYDLLPTTEAIITLCEYRNRSLAP